MTKPHPRDASGRFLPLDRRSDPPGGAPSSDRSPASVAPGDGARRTAESGRPPAASPPPAGRSWFRRFLEGDGSDG